MENLSPTSLVEAMETALTEFEGYLRTELFLSAREHAPKDTGAFIESLQARSRASSTERFVEIFSLSRKPLAVWTYVGYTITAKQKPYMVFRTRDGEWHSVKRVFHRPSLWRQAAIGDGERFLPRLETIVMRHLAAAIGGR